MNDFIARYQDQLTGTLSGFDRLVFRGSLWKDQLSGMKGYLWAHGLGAKDFGAHAEKTSQAVKEASLAPLVAAGRQVRYLRSGKEDKQQLALQIAAQEGIREGTICALTAVELCTSYAIRFDPEKKRPSLQRSHRKCLYLYHYLIHPVFGFMSIRLQTWFPFTVHIYLNGREWAARQMDQAGIAYHRHDNCFTWIADCSGAQALMKEQLKTNWVQSFEPLIDQVHPLLKAQLAVRYPMRYFWNCQDSEWATDFMFRKPDQLRRLVPRLLHQGMVSFSSPDVLHFMGKKVTRQGNAAGGLKLPLSSDLKIRVQGARVKHRLGPNSIKWYDKAYEQAGAVLRTEITISQAKYFQVQRRTDDPNSALAKRTVRQSIVDMHHRAHVSDAALNRYCSGLATVDDSSTLEELTSDIQRRCRWKGRSVRAIHPFDPADHALLQAVFRGEFQINGFRNRDLQGLLYASVAKTDQQKRQRSAAISRQLRMLCAHGLIRKRSHSHRYDLTRQGRHVINAILLAHRLTIQQITKAAAA